MTLSLTGSPAVEPLTHADAETHLMLDSGDHAIDAYIDTLIETAREIVEAHTSRALITQTWTLTRDDFPAGDQLFVPKAPLQSVSSITYVDTDGTTQTWSSSEYVVSTPSGPRAQPGVISLAYDEDYPTVRAERDAVTITFVAGYGDAATDVPAAIKHAMLLLVGEMYERREEGIAGTTVREVPLSVSRLLASYVVGGW